MRKMTAKEFERRREKFLLNLDGVTIIDSDEAEKEAEKEA